ncbi:MAG: sn-glycerol-3-phosphate ABC transporter ATP-binding protein UgpC [Acidimicrobiaceae bacterium]|nr:sn-glycerol-3-phosphate ABC transporter ATP-binding protein UgpC [Acidimicrobiaceae bacterium]
MAAIYMEGITKVYANGFEAVRHLDMAIADGEFMVLVGPSGSGKTTVLRMVAGLEEISSGILKIGDRVVNAVAPTDRDIAMVFQNYALYPHMSVADNIGFALKLRKLPKEDINRRVADAVKILGLTEWIDQRPGQLSGGQRQRVAMGRAIVREPSAFLMDEPLSNLDAQLRVSMRAEVSRIQRRLGVATVYVTHDQLEAMTMGDRVGVMRSGVLQQCDTPQALYEKPVNIFVAAFIGSPAMNLYRAGISADGAELTLGSQKLPIPEAFRGCLTPYRERSVILGIRPENLRIATDSDPSTITATVELVEALGSELLVHFSIDARRETVEGFQDEVLQSGFAVTGEGIARIGPRSKVASKDIIRLSIEADSYHFFDPSSGLALR